MAVFPAASPVRHRAECDVRAEELYAEHSDRVLRYCLRFLRDRSEAEDALQTTFLFALRGLRRGVEPEFESAWLLAIARNVCLSRIEASGRRNRFEVARDVHVLQETAPSPDRHSDDMIRLGEALAELPDQQRRVILLREWQGLSYREIAETMGLSLAAVETHIFRGRRALAQFLTDEQPAEKRKRKLESLNVGSVLLWLKSAFGGGTALKLGAAAAAIASGAVLAVETPDLARAPEPGLAPARPAAAVEPSSRDRATPGARDKSVPSHTTVTDTAEPHEADTTGTRETLPGAQTLTDGLAAPTAGVLSQLPKLDGVEPVRTLKELPRALEGDSGLSLP